MGEHKRVLRFDISLNEDSRRIPAGKVVMFGRSNRNRLPGFEALLDVWVEVETPDGGPGYDFPDRLMMSVATYGTAEKIEPGHEWLASCMDGEVLWHLYRTT